MHEHEVAAWSWGRLRICLQGGGQPINDQGVDIQQGWRPAAVTSPAPRDRGSLHYPVEPMIATSTGEIPVGPGWAYQPKWDGWLH